MKRTRTLLRVLLLCLICLCACADNGQVPQNEHVSSTEETQSPAPNTSDTPSTETMSQEPVVIDHLTFELVIDWEESERLLSEMRNLSQLFQDSLSEQNYQVDDVTITISTAGGITGDALEGGGVDLALMPATDYVNCNETITAVLTTDEELCTTVLAVSGARTELDDAFRNALATALLETDPGSTFLNTYQPGITCVPATEEAVQAVRDWVTEQGSQQHGGN